MARSAGLPALVGIEGLMDEIESGDSIIMDAEEGIIFINTDQATIDQYHSLTEVRRNCRIS